MNTRIIAILFAAVCGTAAFSLSNYLLGLVLDPEVIKNIIIKYFGR